MALPSLRVGGLASGLDSDSIIKSIVTLQTQSIAKIDSGITATTVQISALGALADKVTSLQTAATGLKSGLQGFKTTSTNFAFDTTITAGAVGSFDVEVTALAAAAKGRSDPFASATSTVGGGILHFDVDGFGFNIDIADGATLQESAATINAANAGVRASVLSDGTSSFLSITRTTTGHVAGELPSTALDNLSMLTTGGGGQALNMAITQEASNTVAFVDGLRFEGPTSSITGAIPGVTLTAKAVNTAGPEQLVIGQDSTKTEANLKSFVDAYNAVNSVLQSELDVKPDTDRNKSLAGDGVLRLLQQRLRSSISTANASINVRTLADLGVKTERDGTLTIDSAALASAVNRAGDDVDALFAADGAMMTSLNSVADAFAKDDGIIETRTDGLNDQKKRLEADKIAATERAEQLQVRLLAQFAAMEKIVSSLNATGSFLTSLSNQKKQGE